MANYKLPHTDIKCIIAKVQPQKWQTDYSNGNKGRFYKTMADQLPRQPWFKKRTMGPINWYNETRTSETVTANTKFILDVTTSHIIPLNATNNSNTAENDAAKARFNEIQIIKAIFLAVVTIIILISICKMVFQLFVRYTVKEDDR
uniref:Uncharacterized protein n=1 Tax=Rhodnius prolixus TaxID=13249 RepID=T1I156_RHOPR